ncbi:L-arabinose transport system permease protein AraQ [Gottschalkia purinilytica]|uniref:L-arabinose transport system permease protein AraQ n=1 Tax=Gottschalkia purinilytica TaxID=1503 RepID=A0A0L0W856_GOTPU|nr:carbohydrate ABC transporter permease [Gottschalkia purinilytica]KNF07734.1 L-arabinose transport system permease protein AraQ [Gottschalkia purinilytica]
MKKIKILNVLSYTILIAGCVITLLPFIWMLSTSFKGSGEIYILPPKFIPDTFNWGNYNEVFNRVPMKTYFINSLVVTFIVTIGTLITSILAAFAFSRIQFKGRDIIFAILLGTMMVPGEMLIAPNFVTLSKLNLINTRPALYIPWLASVSSIFFVRQFFLTVPEELYHAAKVDGCSDFKYMIKIMVPFSKPALITVGLLKIIYSWNEFLWPLLMTSTPDKRTLPVGLTNFMTEAGAHYNLLMAYSSIVIIPIIGIYIFLQKYIMSGVTRAGIKG